MNNEKNQEITIYKVFAFLWAMSIIWHYLRPDNSYPVSITDLVVIISATLVLIRPSNIYFLVCMALANAFVFLSVQPSASNHWMLQFFVNLTLVASFIYTALHKRSSNISHEDLLDSFLRILMMLVLLLYFFAVLAKLNEGYFRNESFAIVFYRDILFAKHLQFLFPLMPRDENILKWMPHLSLIAESMIPILLLFKRTRVFGIIIAFSFHTFLSIRELPPATDFPITLAALYILFFPDNSQSLLETTITTIQSSRIYQVFHDILLPASLLILIFVPQIGSLNSLDNGITLSFQNAKASHWAIYVIIFLSIAIFMFYKVRFQKLPNDHVSIFKGSKLALIWIPIIALFVGFSPYLGLRTHSAFAMYSNLETEGSYTNHFFIPSDFQIFDYQKQVCVIETSASNIPLSAHTGELFTYYDFRKLAIKNTEESITYTFNGQRFELDRIGDKLEIAKDFTPFEKWYLIFQRTNWKNKTTYCNNRW